MRILNKELIQIALAQHEALVLFEWLASLDEKSKLPLDEAEQKVIWRLEGQLESMLPEIVAADYRERVLSAKQTVLTDNQ